MAHILQVVKFWSFWSKEARFTNTFAGVLLGWDFSLVRADTAALCSTSHSPPRADHDFHMPKPEYLTSVESIIRYPT